MRTNKLTPVLIAITFIAFAGTTARATLTVSIVSSFQSPAAGHSPTGIDYYGGRLYHESTTANGLCYETNLTGSIISTFPLTYNIWGIEVEGNDVWAARDFGTYCVYRYTTNGSLISSFVPAFTPDGVTKQGQYLWFVESGPGRLYKTNTSGSVLASFSVSASSAGDIDFSGQYLWYTDQTPPTKILKYTTTGSLVDSISNVPGCSRPAGCCWDGTYLWYNDYYSPYYVFKALCYSVGVEPASFGKVKAIFR